MKTTEQTHIDNNKFHVIIESIGTADPSASKMLADILGTPVELVVKALYNPPAVLFSNIDQALANKCNELLDTLGIISKIQKNSEELPKKPESLDVGIYIHDIHTISSIAKKLSKFLGCDLQEAFNLLTNDPCVIMGGVSQATAEVLCDRLETEVIISNPKKDLYTLSIDAEKENPMILHKLQNHLTYLKIKTNLKETNQITNLDYLVAQEIWKKFQSSGLLKMINQSFQRFEINLVEVDKTNDKHKKILVEEIGMPTEIIANVIENLPIQLEASANGKTVTDKIKRYKDSGLICNAYLIKPNNYRLIIEEIENLEQTKNILSQYIETEFLPHNTKRWKFPKPLGDLLFRCVSAELEAVNCSVDYEFYIK